MKQQQVGQAAFVLERIDQSDRPSTHLPKNAIGWAVEKVQAPSGLAPLVKRLLHNVALFETLEEALLASVKDAELAAATLEGEYISHNGILFGGSGKVRTDSLLARKAQMDAIRTELRQLKREQAAAEERRVSLQSEIIASTNAVENAIASHQSGLTGGTLAVDACDFQLLTDQCDLQADAGDNGPTPPGLGHPRGSRGQ